MEESAWAEFWAGGESDQAVGGRHRERLAEAWRVFFRVRSTPPGAIALDIAAGTGAAMRVAAEVFAGPMPTRPLLIATDFSAHAVGGALRTVGAAVGFVSDAARLPLADRSVAVAISQFGIEYAGTGAFSEAARILAPGGRFMSISHYAGGAIDAECAENARLLDAIERSGVNHASHNALSITYQRRARSGGSLTDDVAEKQLQKAMQAASAAIQEAPRSAARDALVRFIGDLSTLCARRLAYNQSDAIGWINGMSASLGAYGKRMQSMRASALDGAHIDRIGAVFADAGLAGFTAEPLILDAGKPPAAWVIRAERLP